MKMINKSKITKITNIIIKGF